MTGKPAAPLPETLGRYRILRPLGQGGMGAVYLALDTELDRQVALKIPNLSAADGVLERFYREARAAATLRHPNICPVFDIGEFQGIPYLTMAFIEGKPLGDFVRFKPPTQKQIATLVRKLALALHEAHQRGVIHRDLKPANIMIDKRGDPIVMDFGLARRFKKDDPRLTRTGAIIGTPAYMPPEQISTTSDSMGPACDIYSLGVILYELLAGRLPYSGDAMAMLAQILTDDPPRPTAFRPEVDPALEAISLKAMAKKPEQRFSTMAELAGALQEYLRGNTPSPGAAPGAATRPRPTAAETPPPAAAETQAPDLKLSIMGGNRSMAQAGQELNARRPLRPGAPTPRRRPRRRAYPSWLLIGMGGGGAALLIGVVALFLKLGGKPSEGHGATASTVAAAREATGPARAARPADPTPAAANETGTGAMDPLVPPPKGDSDRAEFARPPATTPEVITLDELPANAYNSAPWVAPDGLKLYWQSAALGAKQRWIWVAERKHKFARFENQQRLMPGADPTVTADGLVMIFLDGANLYETSRTTSFQGFWQPRRLTELDPYGFLSAPCLSDDGLVLHADRVAEGKAELVRFTRATRNHPWSKPTTVAVAAPGLSGFRFFWISAGGRRAFACIPDRLPDPNANNLVMLTGRNQGLALDAPVFIEFAGQNISGKFPRYVAATGELFFSTNIEPNGTAQIRVIRGFDPDKLTVRPAGGAPSARATRSADPSQAAPPRQGQTGAAAAQSSPAIRRGVWFTLDPDRASAWPWDGNSTRKFKIIDNGAVTLHNASLVFPIRARDLSIRAKVKYIEGQGAALSVRGLQGNGGYDAWCNREPGGMFAFSLSVIDQKGAFKELRRVRRKDTYGGFVELKLTAVGDQLTVHANGEKVIELRDGTKVRKGDPGLNAYHTRAQFKEIEVMVLED